MSEFTVRAVDFEEKSLAEKETELLKAHEEQVEETPTIDLSNVETPTDAPIDTPPANEPVELDESSVVSYLGKRWNREINSLDDLAEQRSANEDLPEDVSAFLKYKKETGRGIEDFINLNRDYNTMDQDTLLLEYNREQNKGLDLDDVKFELETRFGYDEDFDDEKEIKKKQVAKKKELAKAKEYFNQLKDQYKVPLESRETFVPQEERDAYSAYKKQIESGVEIQEDQAKKSKYFADKTNELFSDKFEGFGFNIDENKKVVYTPADAKSLIQEQSNLSNFVNKFLNEEGYLKDAEVFHRAIAVASNPEKFAKFFYEKGKAEAVDGIAKESKNIDMVRQAPQVTNKSEGLQVRASEPSGFGNRLVIKSKNKN
jgi:hypothetical protein